MGKKGACSQPDDDLDLIPGACMVEREYAVACAHVQTHILNK